MTEEAPAETTRRWRGTANSRKTAEEYIATLSPEIEYEIEPATLLPGWTVYYIYEVQTLH